MIEGRKYLPLFFYRFISRALTKIMVQKAHFTESGHFLCCA